MQNLFNFNAFHGVPLFLLVICLLSAAGGKLQHLDDCESLLVAFANSAADFVLCAISKARPIKMCSSCIGAYNYVVADHNKILEISESDNKTCKNRLINLDRLEIIEAGYTYVTSLWDKGRCPNCLDSDGNIAIHVSNETSQFQKLFEATDKCLNSHFISENQTYDPFACQNCSSLYERMNVLYDSMKLKFGDGQLCMDIVDAMNVTQNRWSGDLHCGEDIQAPEIGLIASCTTVLALPIIFYFAAWKLSASAPALVSKQKRLSTRFVERWRSRTGSMISQLRNS